MENRKKVNTDKCVLGNLQKSFTLNRNLIGKNDWLSFARVRLAVSHSGVSVLCITSLPFQFLAFLSYIYISYIYIYI